MACNWKSKRFDDFILMFNNKFFSMSKYSSNNILPLQLSSNKVGESIDIDSPMGINFSDKRDFSFRNRQLEIPFMIHICGKTKAIGQMSERFPYLILKYAGKSCTIFLCSKPSMGLSIMIVLKESFAGSPEGTNGWAIMSLEHSLLPECPRSTTNISRSYVAGFFRGSQALLHQKSPRNGSECRKLPDESTWNYRFNGHLSRYFHIPLIMSYYINSFTQPGTAANRAILCLISINKALEG